MIITNSLVPVVDSQGLKEVNFVMMLTDDTLQDEHEVACTKAEVYENHLPDRVSHVIFCTDRASCFQSLYHQAIQPHWLTWTGIEEIVFKLLQPAMGNQHMMACLGE